MRSTPDCAAAAEIEVFRLAGDHREMGRQHGHQARRRAGALRAAMAARLDPLHGDAAAAAASRALLDVVRAAAPELVAMLEGMAEGLDLPFDQLWAYTAAGYVADLRRAGGLPEGCTVWAAAGDATDDRRPVLAKSRDYALDHRPLQVLVEARPASGYRWLALGSAGSPGVFSSGLNEVGLAVADTHVPARDVGPGLPRYGVMMRLLERCQDVPAALALLARLPQLGTGNLVLADAQGRLALAELAHRRQAVEQWPGGLVVATNHYRHPSMRRLNLDPAEEAARASRARSRLVARLLARARGQIDLPLALAIARRHGRGRVSVCRHAIDPASATISAIVYQPAAAAAWLLADQPCRTDPVAVRPDGDGWRVEPAPQDVRTNFWNVWQSAGTSPSRPANV